MATVQTVFSIYIYSIGGLSESYFTIFHRFYADILILDGVTFSLGVQFSVHQMAMTTFAATWGAQTAKSLPQARNWYVCGKPRSGLW